MLTTCPECNSQVSDKALMCPHCGFPLQRRVPAPQSQSHKRPRQKLPNGFGQITKITNQRLRKPFRAMVTVGVTPEGRPISKILRPQGYFRTYNEAYRAIMEYHDKPCDLSQSITMEQLHDLWRKDKKGHITLSSLQEYDSVWKYCSSVYPIPIQDIRVRDLKICLANGSITIGDETRTASVNIRRKMKILFNQLFDYAVENEITSRNVARMFNLHEDAEPAVRAHIPYTEEEVAILDAHVSEYPIIEMLQIQFYSGWRPGELCDLLVSNVDLENKCFTGGKKTRNGINRTIPIHSKIFPLVEKHYHHAVESGNEHLFCDNRKKPRHITYETFSNKYRKLIKELGLNPLHRAHDGRVHFVTTAKKANMDEYAIKRIVGHAITDLTERVYTYRNIEWLRSELEKIS